MHASVFEYILIYTHIYVFTPLQMQCASHQPQLQFKTMHASVFECIYLYLYICGLFKYICFALYVTKNWSINFNDLKIKVFLPE